MKKKLKILKSPIFAVFCLNKLVLFFGFFILFSFFSAGIAKADVVRIGASSTYYESYSGCVSSNPTYFTSMIDFAGTFDYEAEMTFNLSSIPGSATVNSAKVWAYKYITGATPAHSIEKIASSICDATPNVSSPPPNIGSAVMDSTAGWKAIDITPSEVLVGDNFYIRWWGNDLDGAFSPVAYFRGPAQTDLTRCGGSNPSGAADCRPYIEIDYTIAAPPPVDCAAYNVCGFAWSENIGWISFSSTTYGVRIASSTGNFSGYAWSEHIGWISFNTADLAGCPAVPCEAKVNKSTGEVSGWARVLSYGGGWDGWIKLRGTSYGVSINTSSGEFSGYAWSDMVIGWLKFKGTGYGVVVDSSLFVSNQPPTALMGCNTSGCLGGFCDGSWLTYQPTAQPPCNYRLVNNSTDTDDGIAKTDWYIKKSVEPDVSYRLIATCSGVCDRTLQSTDVPDPDNYTVKLYVEDTNGAWDTAIRPILEVRREIAADFTCSLTGSPGSWRACETLSGEVEEGELVYFNDTSIYSDTATQITSRTWQKNGIIFSPGGAFGANETNPYTTMISRNNIIRLTVRDNAFPARTDWAEHTISVKLPLPEYKEVPPISWFRKIFIGLLAALF